MAEYYSGFLNRGYEGDQLATLLPGLLWPDEGLDVGDEGNFSVQIHHTYEEGRKPHQIAHGKVKMWQGLYRSLEGKNKDGRERER